MALLILFLLFGCDATKIHGGCGIFISTMDVSSFLLFATLVSGSELLIQHFFHRCCDGWP